MPKTMIAMSGGADSSAAARLIKDMGHDICGAIMTLYGDNSKDIKDAWEKWNHMLIYLVLSVFFHIKKFYLATMWYLIE